MPKSEKLFYSADGEIRTRILSLDFDYLFSGIQNNGWGLGFRYEQYLFKHLALKIGFGHSTFVIQDSLCPSVSFSLFGEVYPFEKGLDGFYIALGGYFDFMSFENADKSTGDGSVELLSVCPLLGYKVRLHKFLSADFYAGYKYIYSKETESEFDATDYISSGIKIGATMKVHFK